MEQIVIKKIILWLLLSINLLAAFFVGLITFSIGIIIGISLGCIIVPILSAIIYLVLSFFKIDSVSINIKKKISIWSMLSFTMLFAYLIGATIPLMETKMWIKYNMAYLMLPLLIILNYIIFDRYHYYQKHANGRKSDINEDSLEKDNLKEIQDRPVIEFEGKKYIFSIRSLALVAIGAPLLSYIVYLFFDNQMNYWLHEIVVKQTVFFLNSIFNMNVEARYHPGGTYHWSYVIPGRGEIYFETFCTGVQAIAVFAGIIICTPHSRHRKTNEDIVWRKTKSLIMSSVIFYVVNIIRMVIQIYLYSIGYEWVDIHYSISAASSFIAAIIVLLLHRWIPEFIISIIYAGTLVSKKLKERRGIVDEKEEEK